MRPLSHSGRRAAAAVAATLTCLSAFVLANGNGAAEVQPARVTLAGQPAGSVTVTLITGDRVMLGTGPQPPLRVEPANPLAPMRFAQFARHGDWYVIPGDAAALLRSGVLDRELFNVTGLVRQGYDDARTDALPLLVKDAKPPAGARPMRTLPKLGITAVSEPKKDAAALWSTLRAGPATARGSGARIWLNRRVHAALDVSVPRIGAPTAWQAGYRGRGVTVAVLDTGIAADHPDFAGRIGPTKDFSGKGSVADGNGHGTHVASTAAGSGAASDGKYQGVAPEATIAAGKVLDDSGSGTMDAVLAGMEWAAGEVGAKVVNMSLSSGPTDGTDPVSAAVNELTNATGALFVTAAGNDGAEQGVSSPATADAALAVGSVSKEDVPSEFSNRGPRLGDFAVKPDLVAPGEAIAAARPAAVDPIGEPVGDAYQRLDGTSMATPHVAGAAALLAQQHPDWPGERLKSALMSTAAPVAGADVFAVGAGRVDVARAISQAVSAVPGSVSAYLRWPNAGVTQRHAVTYDNTGSEPVTLDLDLSPDVPATLSATTVTVPAGGQAKVELTVTARDGGAGAFGGVLTATGPNGIAVRTPVGVRQEPAMHDLTVRLLDRNGDSAGGRASAYVIGIENADFHIALDGDRLRLPAGSYAVHGYVETPRAGQEPSRTTVVHPELSLRDDTEIILDARLGRRTDITLDEPAARGGVSFAIGVTRVADGGPPYQIITAADPRLDELYAATVDGITSDRFAFVRREVRHEPAVELHAEGTDRFEVNAGWFGTAPASDLREELTAVHGGQGRPEDLTGLDATGRLVLLELPATLTDEEVDQRVRNVAASGAKLAMLMVQSEPMAAARTTAAPSTLPTLIGYGPTAARLAAATRGGAVPVRMASHRVAEHRYELAFGTEGRVPERPERTVRTSDLVAVHAAYHRTPGTGPYRAVAAWAQVAGIGAQGLGFPMRTGAERVEYFTPGTWDLESIGSEGWQTDELVARGVRLRTGKPARVEWNKAVAGPTLRGCVQSRFGAAVPCVSRAGNALVAQLPLYGDAAGHPRHPGPRSGSDVDTGSTSLFRDGHLVATHPTPGAGRFEVPAAGASYRLVADATRTATWWPLSTKVHAEWTFRSSAADDGKALPLLTVRFDPAVDLNNTAPGAQAFAIPLRIERQDGPANITALTVDVSYDDGATWSPAKMAGSRALIHHPPSGFVSLRVKSADADGNTLQQSIIRAYQLSA
ncbi:S8 family serine peptidase [Phytohabitans rumicis]|uniref:Peptidase n=1 Tax=Phytohabitans rumicis TaxID=1076125 RepID=A0A6V8KY81_9ACTN|nr:S8 family serine peptidase [Phytohabitans rumicis]GFJ86787.1 peptidase [Phytohabitans rumicis]